jgi:hypothetical protein
MNPFKQFLKDYRRKHPGRTWTDQQIIETLLESLAKEQPERVQKVGVDAKGETIWRINRPLTAADFQKN